MSRPTLILPLKSRSPEPQSKSHPTVPQTTYLNSDFETPDQIAVTLTHFPTGTSNKGKFGPKEERDEMTDSILEELQRTWRPVNFTVSEV